MPTVASLALLLAFATPPAAADAVVEVDRPPRALDLGGYVAAGLAGATAITAGISGIVLAGRTNGLKAATQRFGANPTPDQSALLALKHRQVAGTQLFVAGFSAGTVLLAATSASLLGIAFLTPDDDAQGSHESGS